MNDMNLPLLVEQFQSEEKCRAYLEGLRWPSGVSCPRCASKKVSRIASRGQFDCDSCRYQFSVTAGTIFHDSHLPLWKWLLATYMMAEAKKSVSANQLKRTLAVSYKTAWYLCHRIRAAMKDTRPQALRGVIEVDETYVGGKQKGKGVYYGKKQKQVVVGLRQRKGPLRFIHTKDAKANTLKAIIEEHIGEEVQYIMTDESSASWGALLNNPKHKVIRHNIGKYVEGIVHTNSIESAFSLLKRGIIGSFHRISIKHLHRYLAEFQYRFNARNDADRFERMVQRLLQTDAMEYKQLIADPVSTQ